MMKGLFRREVIEQWQQAWIGEIQVLRPLSITILTALIAAIAVAVGAFLVYGEYTKKARIVGVLVPDRGVVRLLPPSAATVVERHVHEGQRVREGEVLFVLSPDVATRSGDTQATVQANLAERGRSLRDSVSQQQRLVQAQRADLGRRVADAQREAEQIAAEVTLNRERLALAQQALARIESLKADNFVSSAQVQSKAEDVLALRAQIASLERQRAAQQRDLGALEAERAQLPLRESAQRSQTERELLQVAQQQAEAESRRRIVIRAPHDATVTAVTAEIGQAATPGTALATLVGSEARLQAHLFAPSSAVGFVVADQTVRVRYRAYPYQKFGHHGGRVVAVSRTPLQGGELSALPIARSALAGADEPLYRITVELDRQSISTYGVERPLAIGMQLDADVLLDRRRLIEWLFEPLVSVTGRV